MPSSYSAHCIGLIYGRQLSEEMRTIHYQPFSLEDNNSKILMLFQAPGVEEWKSGKPISSSSVKSAGGKLRTAFQSIEKTRFDNNISNVIQCFPGQARTKENDKLRDKSPPKAACNACSKWLADDMSKGSYKRIIVFGNCAKEAVKRLRYGKDPLALSIFITPNRQAFQSQCSLKNSKNLQKTKNNFQINIVTGDL